jgi:hypothetical protein
MPSRSQWRRPHGDVLLVIRASALVRTAGGDNITPMTMVTHRQFTIAGELHRHRWQQQQCRGTPDRKAPAVPACASVCILQGIAVSVVGDQRQRRRPEITTVRV